MVIDKVEVDPQLPHTLKGLSEFQTATHRQALNGDECVMYTAMNVRRRIQIMLGNVLNLINFLMKMHSLSMC